MGQSFIISETFDLQYILITMQSYQKSNFQTNFAEMISQEPFTIIYSCRKKKIIEKSKYNTKITAFPKDSNGKQKKRALKDDERSEVKQSLNRNMTSDLDHWEMWYDHIQPEESYTSTLSQGNEEVDVQRKQQDKISQMFDVIPRIERKNIFSQQFRPCVFPWLCQISPPKSKKTVRKIKNK